MERIADHATNIAEDLIFVVEAKDVRHHEEQKTSCFPPRRREGRSTDACLRRRS
jgi:hypothetical protein